MLVLGILLERMTPHPDILTLEPFLVLAELFEKVQLLNLTRNCGGTMQCEFRSNKVSNVYCYSSPPTGS